jgi:hypothetical protein
VDYAVRNNYKTATTAKEFSKLSPTQKSFRFENTLGKGGAKLIGVAKGLGTAVTIVNTGYAAYQLYENPTAGNATRLAVQGIAIGSAFIPGVGWAISLSIGAADVIWGDDFYNCIDNQ